MKIMKQRTGGLRSLITERKTLSVFLLVLVLPSSAFAACEDWVARIVSIQGSVDIRASGTQAWQVAGLQQTYCEGDVIRVNATSRAALELHNETIIRLNQNSTLILSGPKKDVSWLDLIKGSLHAITRVPRSLKIKTPFVNAAVEGTEFQVQVKDDNTLVGVIEGIVKVSNEYGNLLLAQDQSAITYKGNAPVLRLDIKPADSVHWSLYYPRLNVGGLQQAEDLISAGQEAEAERILANQTSAEALSLKTIIAIAHNRKQQALDLSAQAIKTNQNSVAGHMAQSYALQANFELHPALKAAQKAVSIDGQHALAWVRLAELYLTLGEIDKGLAAARKAVELKPDLARTQVILGYAHLLQHNTKKARQVFARSIKLDSSDPLARLGTGLAEIRGGNLRKGRREIEIAASLDTNNAQIRSYLGKAYLEEKRNKLAADQFALAKQMDPNDPTPWLYNALRKQSENKPVEALNELQQSIKLNNNRAVYRSSFQLDDDRATRGAGLGRIYQELGFEQLALKEATRSISVDQTNAAAHRLLADAYLSKARHEIARVSELLQSQMLQSINTAPLQPQMGESTLTLLNNLGVGNAAFNEYNSLFMRNRIKLGLNTVSAGNNTFAGEFIASGVMNNFSISAGKYSYETDGFHSNNEDDQLLENVFMQYAATPNTSLLFEASTKKRVYGDLLRFDPANFSQTLNNIQDIDRRRLGITHKLDTRSTLMLTTMKDKRIEFQSQGAGFFTFSNEKNIDSVGRELRYLYQGNNSNVTFGYSFNKSSSIDTVRTPFGPPSVGTTQQRNSGAYVYFYPVLDNMNLTTGLSRSHFQTTVNNRDSKAYSKKFGIELDADVDTTFRLAYFETFRRPILNNQTLEPTSVAGFNQFYDDRVGTQANNYAMAIDHQVNHKLKVGVELLKRNLSVPFVFPGPTPAAGVSDWQARNAGLYAYWLPRKDLAINIGLRKERLERDQVVATNLNLIRSSIYKLPIGINWFHPSGWVVRSKLTYVRQQGDFENVFTSASVRDKDNFVVVDTNIEYRFRDGTGGFTIGALNLFDESFRYQDADINRQLFAPGRVAFMRLNLVF